MTLSPISGTELGEQNESYLDLIQEIYAALRKFTNPYYDTSIQRGAKKISPCLKLPPHFCQAKWPAHAQPALMEHVSLNLAPLILLDPTFTWTREECGCRFKMRDANFKLSLQFSYLCNACQQFFTPPSENSNPPHPSQSQL